MDANRRDVVKGAALGGVTVLGGGAAVAAPVGNAPLVHHVFFWLKNAGSAADRDVLIAGLRTLAAIPVIRSLHIGVPAATEQRGVVDASFDVSELMTFDDATDQKTYQDHPIHRAFVARCEPLWHKVVVYDTVDVGKG